jgi:hypothetical protein
VGQPGQICALVRVGRDSGQITETSRFFIRVVPCPGGLGAGVRFRVQSCPRATISPCHRSANCRHAAVKKSALIIGGAHLHGSLQAADAARRGRSCKLSAQSEGCSRFPVLRSGQSTATASLPAVLELLEMAALTELSAAIEPLLRVREGMRPTRPFVGGNRIHWMRRPTQHSYPCIEALGRRARRVTNRIRSPR